MIFSSNLQIIILQHAIIDKVDNNKIVKAIVEYVTRYTKTYRTHL